MNTKITLNAIDAENIKIKYARVLTTIDLLVKTFPLLFFPLNTHTKPLKIGIFNDIIRSGKVDISKAALKQALQYYVGNLKYKKGFLYHTHRYNLNGKVTSKITEEEKSLATKEMLLLIKNANKKRKLLLESNRMVVSASKNKPTKNIPIVTIKRKRINTAYTIPS